MLEEVPLRTANKQHRLSSYESKITGANIPVFWHKIITLLEVEKSIEIYAIRLLFELSTKDIKIDQKLIFKYFFNDSRLLIVCLIISEKICADSCYDF